MHSGRQTFRCTVNESTFQVTLPRYETCLADIIIQATLHSPGVYSWLTRPWNASRSRSPDTGGELITASSAPHPWQSPSLCPTQQPLTDTSKVVIASYIPKPIESAIYDVDGFTAEAQFVPTTWLHSWSRPQSPRMTATACRTQSKREFPPPYLANTAGCRHRLPTFT